MARKLSGEEKAAVFLTLLGEDLAADVMKNLDAKDVQKIGRVISRPQDISPEELGAILMEFNDRTTSGMGMSVGGRDYIQKVLTKAIGSEKTTRVMENLATAEEGWLDTIKWMDPRAIAQMLRSDHPQTIALILIHLDPDLNSQVLNYLPETLRSDVLHRMATLEEIPPGVMKELGDVINEEMARVGTAAGRKVGGIKLVADLLNQMGPSQEQVILGSIGKANPELAEQIRKLMFVFEDLINLDDRNLQEVLKEVSKEQLTIALKAAKEEIKDKFYKNMSQRAVDLLKEDLEALGPVKLSEVEKNQQAILKIVQRLSQEGKIVIAKSGGEVFV
ncbi:MAG: flagellar motor switch protein FliG [Nitrospirae bacterium]|nr:flagellar motor switch protein FliG [Nitrospirota bacterium]MBI3594071.1 flagellar motor switch protein FliG [Nitrospirota bacterium]